MSSRRVLGEFQRTQDRGGARCRETPAAMPHVHALRARVPIVAISICVSSSHRVLDPVQFTWCDVASLLEIRLD